MPATFTAPIAQPAMAGARIVNINLDVEGQVATIVYQPLDGAGKPLGQLSAPLVLTFAQLGITKAGVYNAVLSAEGLTGTVT